MKAGKYIHSERRKEEKPHLHVCIKIKEMWRIFQVCFFIFSGDFLRFSLRGWIFDFKFIHLTFDSNRTSFLHRRRNRPFWYDARDASSHTGWGGKFLWYVNVRKNWSFAAVSDSVPRSSLFDRRAEKMCIKKIQKWRYLLSSHIHSPSHPFSVFGVCLELTSQREGFQWRAKGKCWELLIFCLFFSF